MIRWGNAEILYLLILVPALAILLHYVKGIKSRRELENFVSAEVLGIIAPRLSFARKRLKDYLVLAALALLIIALADPQVGTRIEEVKREGIDLVVAVDVSTSMLAKDIAPSRLEKAKHEVRSLLDKLQGDRVALVAFAGKAVIECPLTLDYGAAEIFLDVLEPGLVSKPGTSLADAVRTSLKAFPEGSRAGKAILLITDGEDHSPDLEAAIKEAADKGVVIHAVGIGSPQGVPIPLGGADGEYKKDKQGNVIVTKLDEGTLRRIAEKTGGVYQRCSTGGDELDAIISAVTGLEKGEFGTRKFTRYEHRYQIPVFFALMFLVFEWLLSDRKMKLPRLFRFLSQEEPR